MMIDASPFIALRHNQMAVLLENVRGMAPVWRHWGAPVGDPPFPASDIAPPASFAPDGHWPLTVAPTDGDASYAPPIVRVHRDGRDFALRWDEVSAEQSEDGSWNIMLRDRLAVVELHQRLTIIGDSETLALDTRVINIGNIPLSVDILASAIMPLPADAATLLSFTGRHNAEFVEQREPMPSQQWVRDEARGMTGHAGPPGLFVLRGGADWHQGGVYAVQLAWSGSHRLSVSPRDDGGWTLAAGASLRSGEVTLAPGESHAAPTLLATYSSDGINGALWNFHRAIRARGPAITSPRRVHLNSWEGLYFDQDAARITALIDRAADLGIERFVLDDGWFPGRANDRAGLGDWRVDSAKYPDGLRPIADHVIARGMDFGLWVEPEMVNPDSDLYRAHPEWALTAPDHDAPTARNQLLLDLGRSEVRDYLFDCLAALLTDLPIAYFKWDHNRHLVAATGADGRPGYQAQIAGAYALFARLRDAFPAVEIEACAGGGGRIDAGIAQYTHRFWTSDNIDPVSRVAMQRGYLHFMPPERMGAHVGASPAHATGRRSAMAFRGAVAMAGHFGVELDPGTLELGDKAVLSEWIARYKQWRDHLHSGRTWLGDAPDGIVWQAVGDPAAMLLSVTRREPTQLGRPLPLRLPMLAADQRYRIRLETIADERLHGRPSARWLDQMATDGVEIDGNWLREVGLAMPVLGAPAVAWFSIEAIG